MRFDEIEKELDKIKLTKKQTEQINNALEYLRAFSVKVNQSLYTPIQHFVKAVEKINVKAINEFFVNIQQGLGDALKRLKPLLIKAELRDAHFYILDEDFLMFITDKQLLLNESSISNVCEFYIDNQCAELVHLMSDWGKYEFIQHRIPILNSCKEAIKKIPITDAANVVIPVLFAQIDGMAKDFYTLIDESLQNKAPIKHRNILKQEVVQDALIFDNCVGISILSYIFPEKPLEDCILNRNGVMHGEIYNYGTEIELLRMVSCFDVLLKAITDFIEHQKQEKAVKRASNE